MNLLPAVSTLALVGEMDACALWRVLLPTAAIQADARLNVIAEWGHREDNRLARLVHLFDAVVLPRLHWLPGDREKAIRWVDALHRAGKKVIYELDDDLLTDAFVQRLITTHGKDPVEAAERRDGVIQAIGLADGVTVSSQRLATIVRQHTERPVMVVPNYIDLDWFSRVQRAGKRVVRGLTIGWAGGARPDRDVEQMAEAWGRLARRYPQVTFVVMGHQPEAITRHVPLDRLAGLPWMSLETYPQGMKNIDIGCCPLSSEPFNRAKTYIKALEYAAGGAAVVASPTVYGQILRHGDNGLICETADEWEAALSELVEDSLERERMARALLKDVKAHHTLKANAWRWPAAWKEIVEK